MRIAPQGKEIGIDQVRNMNNFLSQGAWQSPYKTVIIEYAGTMGQEAQSALLKSLEEPRGQVLILLLVETANALLATVRSRAQEIKFYTLAVKKHDQSFAQLQKSTLHERFAFAKKLAATPEKVSEILSELLWGARTSLLESLPQKKETREFVQSASIIQETISLCRLTNANTRLALERMMLTL